MPDHEQPRELTQNEKDGLELLRRTSVSGNMGCQADPPRPVRDRAELVMEIAMRKRFRERKHVKRERPNIAQLEKMLNDSNPPAVDILPDGSVMTTEEQPVFISDLLKCALGALYEDGFQIVEKPEAASGPSLREKEPESMDLRGALAAAKIALHMFTNTPAEADSQRRMVFRLDPNDYLQIRQIEEAVDQALVASAPPKTEASK
jgi:hypothetical protein